MPPAILLLTRIVAAVATSLACLDSVSCKLNAQSPESYLPLEVGTSWVLRHPAVQKPVKIEVLRREGDGFRIRFDSPFGNNDWTLVPRGGAIVLSQFGNNGQMMDLPGENIYFDFGKQAGQSWKTAAGEMTVRDREAQVQTAQRRYDHAIRISQGKDLVFTFAPNVGFVQFGEGRNAFVLDEAASRLPGIRSRPSPAAPQRQTEDDLRPVPHVPGGPTASNQPSVNANRTAAAHSATRRRTASGPALVGITVSTFANEAQTPQNLLRHWQQTLDTGVNFVASNGKWDELEPKKGDYKLDGLSFQISEAEKHNLQVAYTLRLIDTVDRTMPSELRRKKWTDPEMVARVMRLIEAVVPKFNKRVKWFMFGNEIDGYFGRHPDEVQDFAALYDRVSRRVKELAPGIQVSSTIMYGGIETLEGPLKPLNDRFDFLSITYYPIRGDFTMKNPDIVTNDFAQMRTAANGRGVVLQEIGYASSATNGSSEEKQAQFIRNVFEQLRANRDVFEAGSFFVLSDLSDQFVKSLAGFYGMPNTKTFLAFLQTTGLFNLQGKPKQGWSVFQDEMRRLGK